MAMNFFEESDYKQLLIKRIKAAPKKGRGQLQKLALFLSMHTTRISHIVNGHEHPTLEQASLICQFFGFSELETEYFIVLVSYGRAGNTSLKKIHEKQLQKLRDQSMELANRLPTEKKFTEAEQAEFYSNWFYSAIRLLTSIEGYHNLDSIADRLSLPKQTVRKVLDFLLSTGLCDAQDGKIVMGPKKTHLGADSIMIGRLHSNWRLKALENIPNLQREDLALSAPMSIRISDYSHIRELLASTIEKAVKVAADTDKPEMLACLNIDWFRF